MSGPLSKSTALRVVVVLALAAWSRGYAQVPQSESTLSRIADSLAARGDTTALRSLSTQIPGNQLLAGFATLRLGELLADVALLDRAVSTFREATFQPSASADAWYGAAAARLARARLGLRSENSVLRETLEQRRGAIERLLTALNRDPLHVPSARALAELMAAGAPGNGAARKALLKALEGPAALVAGCWLGLGRLEVASDERPVAVARFERFLALGGDSATGLLELSREAFFRGDTATGQRLHHDALTRATSKEGALALRGNIAWIAEPEELTTYDSLPSDSRAVFLERFWVGRDALENRKPGERLSENFRRIEHAFSTYRINSTGQSLDPRLWVGTVGISLPPLIGGADGTVSYGRSDPFAWSLDARNGGRSGEPMPAALRESRGGQLHDPAISGYYEQSGAVRSAFSAVQLAQRLVDDRGLIYVRFGAPDQRLTHPRDADITSETWIYGSVARRRVFHFMGQGEATTLVPTLVYGNPRSTVERYDNLCGFEAVGCILAEQARAKAGLRPEQVVVARDRGVESIREGLTADEYRVRFEKALDPAVQLFGVRNEANQGRLILAFAVPGRQLRSAPSADSTRHLYPIQLRVSAFDPGRGTFVQVDTLRQFVSPRVLGSDEFLSGLLEVPLEPGRYSVRVTLRQPDADRGAVLALDHLEVPAAAGSLRLGDVVVGRPGSGVQWNSGTQMVPLNPLNGWRQRDAFTFWVTLDGLVPGVEYESEVELRGIVDTRAKPSVGMRFKDQSTSSRLALIRELALNDVPPGIYLLRVTVRTASGDQTATRSTRITIAK